jgi:hypothetical protein
MVSFLKKSFFWFAFYLLSAAIVLYFVVYDRHPSSFLRLWTNTQYAILIVTLLASITNIIFYYPVARGAAVYALNSDGKTFLYAHILQSALMAKAVAIMYWLAAALVLVMDLFVKWSFARDIRLGQGYVYSAPILDMDMLRWGIIAAFGVFLSAIAAYYAIRLKYFVKV